MVNFYDIILVINLTLSLFLVECTRHLSVNKIIPYTSRFIFVYCVIEGIDTWIVQDYASTDELIFWCYIVRILFGPYLVLLTYHYVDKSGMRKVLLSRILLVLPVVFLVSFIIDFLTGSHIFFTNQNNTLKMTLFYTGLYVPYLMVTFVYIMYLAIFKITRLTDSPKKILRYNAILMVSGIFFVMLERIFNTFYFPDYNSFISSKIAYHVSLYGITGSVIINALLLIAYIKLLLIKKNRNKKYTSCGLSSAEINTIMKNMEELMVNEKVYREPEFNIKYMASRLSIPQVYISQILNEHIGLNFYEYVNQFRIKDIISSLNENDNENSIIQLAFQAGFNSLSTFYKYFKKQTGVTPIEYKDKKIRKQVSIQQELQPK